MIFQHTGKIIDDLYMVGTPAMPVYLLDGEKPAVFDAGLAFLGRIYTDGIKEIIGDRDLHYCFLSHSHFDHCGAVAVLKKSFPALKVAASEKVKKVLGRPNAIELIRNLTHAAEQMAVSSGFDLAEYEQFEPFEVDITLTDGEKIDVSHDLTVQALETPGHTWDCLSYLIPEKKVLLASEAVGIPDQTGYIFCDCLVDYDRYYESMARLNQLDCEILCLGHLKAFTGEDAKRYIRDAMAHCNRFLNLAETILAEEAGREEKAVARIKKIEYDDLKGPKQPEPAYLLNLEARVKVIKKRMENNLN